MFSPRVSDFSALDIHDSLLMKLCLCVAVDSSAEDAAVKLGERVNGSCEVGVWSCCFLSSSGGKEMHGSATLHVPYVKNCPCFKYMDALGR